MRRSWDQSKEFIISGVCIPWKCLKTHRVLCSVLISPPFGGISHLNTCIEIKRGLENANISLFPQVCLCLGPGAAAPGSFAEVPAKSFASLQCLTSPFPRQGLPKVSLHKNKQGKKKTTTTNQTLQIFQTRSRRSLKCLGLDHAHIPQLILSTVCLQGHLSASLSVLGSFPSLVHLLHPCQSRQPSK